MATPRKLEPARKVFSLEDFEQLITGQVVVSTPENYPPYFYFFHAHSALIGKDPFGRPKHAGFVHSLQFWYLRNEIKAGRLYVARPRAKEAQ